jgi:anti-anti-sigma factor
MVWASRRDGTIALRASGELDLAAAPVLREHILDAFAERPSRVTIDLRDVTFLDVVCVGVLEQATETAGAHGIALTIANASHEVRRVLGLTGSDLDLTDDPRSDPEAGDGPPAKG